MRLSFLSLHQIHSKVDWALLVWFGNQFRRRKNSEFKSALLRLKFDLVLHPACSGGDGRRGG